MKRLLIIIAAAGLGLALGFGVHTRRNTPAASNFEGSSSPKSSNKSNHTPRTQSSAFRAADDSPLATKLERDLSMSAGVTRWLYWMEAIEKATPGDFPRLARLAKGNRMALRFLGARWVEVAPQQLFDAIAGESRNKAGLPLDDESKAALARVLFDEWPKRDPQAAIAALNEAGDLGNIHNWRMQVATALVDANPELGLRVMAEWHIENYGPRMGGVSKWATADPQHAAEFVARYPSGYVSRLAMEAIGKEWAKTDPGAALSYAASKPGPLSSVLAAAVLQQWAAKDPGQTADWLAAADTQTRNRLSPAFVESWAKKDAPSALSWCQENLSGSRLAQAVGGVLKGAGEKDVAAAAALVSQMEPSSARSEGAIEVARKWFPQLSSAEPIKPETIAWLGGLDAESRRRVLEVVTWNWATSDPRSMGTFLAGLSREEIPDYTESVLARQMVRKNPAETLEWANGLPGPRALSAGSSAFAEWQSAQPDAAMAWLNALPTGDPRRQPFFQSAIQMLVYHPQATAQLAAMTDNDRAAAKQVIQSLSIPEDRRAQLLAALSGHN